MFRKRIFLFVPGLFFFIIATSLYLGHQHLTRLTKPYLPVQLEIAEAEPSTSIPSLASHITSDPDFAFASESAPAEIPVATPGTTSPRVDQIEGPSFTSIPTPPPSQAIIISNGTILDARRIAPFVTAILDPAATHPPRLQCPPLNTTRYDALRTESDAQGNDIPQHIDYFFALNLRNCIDLLPRLLGSIVEAIRCLGPHRCALSIVEGNSPDGTADVLIALRPFLEDLGIHYNF
ncbi:alpha-13-mannosyltransferase [Fusarium albosuccineum]|uniref:Alpha-13-mannosyltransferase n=1 Tax=Fusarium albosuccineum TaxID=1237068 RepID=A0A8H4L6F7_9HYPO|nr:alpha-13-mannosyltransferase [Fusarium albosuccineum]